MAAAKRVSVTIQMLWPSATTNNGGLAAAKLITNFCIRNKGFWAILAILAHKKLTIAFRAKLRVENLVNFFYRLQRL